MTADPDWGFLLDTCIEQRRSPHPGARLWAIETIGLMRSQFEAVWSRGAAAVRERLNDENESVQSTAQTWITEFDEHQG
jgi:hypothetical protein